MISAVISNGFCNNTIKNYFLSNFNVFNWICHFNKYNFTLEKGYGR